MATPWSALLRQVALHDSGPASTCSRQLLADKGACIFVPIDDNEQHHLRMLMDRFEIFRRRTFRAAIIDG